MPDNNQPFSSPPTSTIAAQPAQEQIVNLDTWRSVQRLVGVGDVLEDANGYLLLVTEIHAESGTLIAQDFPEQVIEPIIRVTREIQLVLNLGEFFVIRRPTPEELQRIQRLVDGPAVAPTQRPPAPVEPEAPSVQVPTRFDRVGSE